MEILDDLEELYKDDKDYALDEVLDWLSDETGFCYDGFEIEKEITKESVENELFDFFINKMNSGDTSEINIVRHYQKEYLTELLLIVLMEHKSD